MTQQEFEAIFDKLSQIDSNLAREFRKVPTEQRDEYLKTLPSKLENYELYTSKYNNFDDFIGNKFKILYDLYDQVDGKYPSKARIKTLQEKYPNITEEDIKQYFDLSKKYQEEYEKQDKYEVARKRREKEVKNWDPIRNALTSEYEKARYINEPEKALFGKDAPALGKAPETRIDAMVDLGLGTGAAVAELYPGWGGAIAGPAIRFGRDAYHHIGDDKYAKDWMDIAKDRGMDFTTNWAIARLPNFRKQNKMTAGMGGKNVNKYLNAEDYANSLKKQLDNFPGIAELKDIPNTELLVRVKSLPEGELKNRLTPYVSDIFNIDRAGIADEIARHREQIDLFEKKMKRNFYNAATEIGREKCTPYPYMGNREIEQELIVLPDLSNWEKNLSMPIAKGTRRMLGSYSDQAMRLGSDAGIFPGKSNTKIEGEPQNLVRDFLLGFIPNEYAPDWVKGAYNHWRDEYYKKYHVYPEEDDKARLEE